MLEKQGCKNQSFFNPAKKQERRLEMSNWKCKQCSYQNTYPGTNCKRCNSYNPGAKSHGSTHWQNNMNQDATVFEDFDQVSIVDQESDEFIWIKDSCNINVQTTDTQASISLQVGLQLAIALVVSIAIGDTDRSHAVAQEMLQQFSDEQTNRQKIYVDNSKDVNIVTTDTDVAVNIQAMLEVLLSLVAKLDVL